MNTFTDFQTATPEEMGIPSQALIDFLKRLEDADLPLHSAIVMRHGKIVMESYYKPYDRDTLHRMFSVTKSFVSLAIGLLEEEGKLSLDDQIIKYFPEKLPEEGVHPYIEAMTIRDMLRMASAHDKTTFKVMNIDDWVKTFFHVVPSHVPGTCFSYDTSSTHTLAALVEKLSGMELLDYLRSRFLDELDFSKEAYCIKDPLGVSMGGSGMMATPYDLLKVMYVVSRNGDYNGKQLLPAKYLEAATSKQIETYAKSATFEEMQGYGYQFWRTTHNGVACYGMGGQLSVYLPDEDLIFVTTADAQGRQGGVQLIYDAFWNTVYPALSDEAITQENSSLSNEEIALSQEKLKLFADSREIMSLNGSDTSPIMEKINNKTFILDQNNMGFTKIRLSFDGCDKSCYEDEFCEDDCCGTDCCKDDCCGTDCCEDDCCGTDCCEHDEYEADEDCLCGQLFYSNKSGDHALNFGIGCNCVQNFPHYNYTTAVSGTWSSNDTFLIKAHLIDECIGNIFFQLTFKDDSVTFMMRKVEETMFNEFDGFTSGKVELS